MLRSRFAVAAVGVALVLGACSSKSTATNTNSGSNVSSAQLVSLIQNARSKSETAKTAKFTESIAVTPPTGTVTAINASGEIDFANHLYSFSFNLPGMGTASGVLHESVFYMQLPAITQALSGKPWFKLDAASLKNLPKTGPFGPLASSLESLLKQAESQDPAQGLSFLQGVSGQVTNIGSETVSGTATTHYRFTVDVNKTLSTLPADGQAAIQALLGQFGIATFPAEAWIDGQGLVRKVHMVLTPSPTATPSPLFPGARPLPLPKSTEVTVYLFDYGAPVNIQVPPPDQVSDFGAMLGMLASPSP